MKTKLKSHVKSVDRRIREVFSHNSYLMIIYSPYNYIFEILKKIYRNIYKKNNQDYFSEYGKHTGYIETDSNYTVSKGIDEIGRIITSKDGYEVFRGIFDDHIENVEDIFTICKKNNLLGNYIIKTQVIRDKTIYPFKLILKHELINTISYPYEWSPLMLKDAARFIVRLMRKLNKIDLGLKDAHTYNVTFYRNRFIWYDFGSLTKSKTKEVAVSEFIEMIVNPILMMDKGEIEKAYKYISVCSRLEFKDVCGYFTNKEKYKYNVIYKASKRYIRLGLVDKCCDELTKLLNLIKVNSNYETAWEDYHDNEFNVLNNKAKWSDKQLAIYKMIENIKPNSILDIGGNCGWYGFALNKLTRRYILTETDYKCIDKAYTMIKMQKNIKNITPLVLNFISPPLAYHKNGNQIEKGAIIPWRSSSKNRVKSDCVLVLALIHHLVFGQQLTFTEIINQINDFTNEYAVIEFIDVIDEYVSKWMNNDFSWYNYDSFVAELTKKFIIISTKRSSPKSRTIILCKKR